MCVCVFAFTSSGQNNIVQVINIVQSLGVQWGFALSMWVNAYDSVMGLKCNGFNICVLFLWSVTNVGIVSHVFKTMNDFRDKDLTPISRKHRLMAAALPMEENTLPGNACRSDRNGIGLIYYFICVYMVWMCIWFFVQVCAEFLHCVMNRYFMFDL